MAVAENATTAAAHQAPQREMNLGLASLVGGLILLAGFGLVFSALPVFWSEVLPTSQLNEFLSSTLLLIVGLVALVAVCYVWFQLDRQFATPGLRAGAFISAFLMFAIASLVFTVGNAISQDTPGMFITILLAVALLAGLVFVSTRAAYAQTLVKIDEQGWFHGIPFKPTQGVRVRRGTILAVLVIGISGVITLVTNNMLGSARAGTDDWYWYVPFTSERLYVPLLFRLNMLGPLLLGGMVLWFAWRLVNWPTFADFLIATEAEMNKVSWTTRKRLVQDTIVVLITVAFMTAFLFFIDIIWFKILNSPWVHVLQVNLKAEQQKQQEKTQW